MDGLEQLRRENAELQKFKASAIWLFENFASNIETYKSLHNVAPHNNLSQAEFMLNVIETRSRSILASNPAQSPDPDGAEAGNTNASIHGNEGK